MTAHAPWLRTRIVGMRGATFLVTVAVRWWHPSFWHFIAARFDVRPAILKPFLVAWLVLGMAWALRRRRANPLLRFLSHPNARPTFIYEQRLIGAVENVGRARLGPSRALHPRRGAVMLATGLAVLLGAPCVPAHHSKTSSQRILIV